MARFHMTIFIWAIFHAITLRWAAISIWSALMAMNGGKMIYIYLIDMRLGYIMAAWTRFMLFTEKMLDRYKLPDDELEKRYRRTLLSPCHFDMDYDMMVILKGRIITMWHGFTFFKASHMPWFPIVEKYSRRYKHRRLFIITKCTP